MTNYYLGKIVEVVDRITYEVKVSIDGIVDSKPAFPFRGEVDEPKVGDMVMCKNIDPIYQSMYLYQKLKEDEFIGFRSNGKSIEITPDYIEMKVYKFDESKDSQSAHDDFTGFISRIKIDKEGNIDIDTKPGKVTINIEGDVNSTIKGEVNQKIDGQVKSEISGNVDIKSDGNVTVDALKITLKDLKAIPKVSGSLNCVPVCPFTGLKHYIDNGMK